MIELATTPSPSPAPSPDEPGTPDQFARTRMLLGDAAIAKLQTSRVAVFGIGGVGGFVVEALARGGVGALDLVDSDTVAPSNLNRQIVATHESLGRPKVEVAAERVRAINPACEVRTHQCFYLPENADAFDLGAFDYVVDAVDTVTAKLLIAERAQQAGTPVISCMGTGNKLDPTRFQVADISQTSVDPLAKVMRRECRKRGIKRLKVVFSTEEPLKPQVEASPDDQGQRRSTPGSVPFVPSVAGLIIAGEVIKDLTAAVR